MTVVDANVVIAFLDRSNAHHVAAVDLLEAHAGETLTMHDVTQAEVLAGPAQLGDEASAQVWASLLALGIESATPSSTPLEIARLRASTGLPIPDCLIILAAGAASARNVILSFDARLAAKARALGYTVEP